MISVSFKKKQLRGLKGTYPVGNIRSMLFDCKHQHHCSADWLCNKCKLSHPLLQTSGNAGLEQLTALLPAAFGLWWLSSTGVTFHKTFLCQWKAPPWDDPSGADFPCGVPEREKGPRYIFGWAITPVSSIQEMVAPLRGLSCHCLFSCSFGICSFTLMCLALATVVLSGGQSELVVSGGKRS